MIILSIKTDQPECQLDLYDKTKLLDRIEYLAHQDLARTIHLKIAELLTNQKLNWQDIQGVICFKGPGSFTGLRIGLSVANSLAYGLSIPIIGDSGDDWQANALNKMLAGSNDKTVYPFYGAEPHITQAKK